MTSQSVDAERIKRSLLVLFLIAVSVYLSWFGLSKNLPWMGLLIPALGVVTALISRPAALFILILFIRSGNFMVPGLPGTLTLARLMLLMMIGWAMVESALRQEKAKNSYVPGMDFWMGVFLLDIFLIMAVRGAGFRMLGGSSYGGATYVGLIAAILFYYSVVRIRLSDQHVKLVLMGIVIASILPMAVEILVYHFPGQSWWLTSYFDVAPEYALGQKGMEGGVERWGTFSNFAFALIPIIYVLCRNAKLRFILIVLAVLLVGMTGFRNRVLKVGTLIFFASMYYSKNRMKTFMGWVLVGVAGLVVLVIAAPYLPPAMQRAVSFLPFLEIDFDVARTATGSATWRFDMWKEYCIPNVPKYFFVGRGLSRDITSFAWLSSSWYGTYEFYYHMGRYHSGPFSLLLDYGLLGTVSFTVFFIMVVVDGWKTVKQYAMHLDSFAARYYVFLTLLMTYNLVAFYLIFGDVDSQLLDLLLIAAQMRILKKNFLDVDRVDGESLVS
ncbi:hypothetical protein PDESU_00698 [Pontiella desulfatans]|uniref:O-antigen ligase-related domain-containing protein n=1 Tax=Pontiella desulfatans TaxID=2750659 RepID=A0A6C2TX55_PONDE|nr:O-antigen ligase family protein [Pontiella desulfatans]VGO12147.1 hypothetical protein PDESU_00698 [Pontiella desulfatans]